jgi:antirestriction protein ArdC
MHLHTEPPPPSRGERLTHLRATLDEHLQDLAAQLQQGRSETLVRYLEFSARFHRYSFGNVMLALMQRPDISRLAGLRDWNRQGRHVRSGEKGILILAPMTVRKHNTKHESSDEEEEGRIVNLQLLFKPVYVFDVSQTEGAPLPEIIHAAGDAATLYPRLLTHVTAEGIDVEEVAFIPAGFGARGASYGGRIHLRADLSPADRFRTLVHEYAHERLHRTVERETKTIRETEADAVAFVVCRRFGIETDTADYLLLHDSSPNLLLARLETIRQTAAAIIETLESS